MPTTSTHTATAPTIAADSVDTIAVDSNAVLLEPHFAQAFAAHDSLEAKPHTSTLPALEVMPHLSTAHAPRIEPSLMHDTGAMAMLLTGLLLILISYRTGYKYLENLMHNMFSTRKRENLFEDHTMNETGILTALTINTCIMEALLTYVAAFTWLPTFKTSLQGAIVTHVAAFALAALIFYLAQLGAYNVIGIVFSDKINTKLWTDGFKAAHSMLGLLLFPVLAIIFVLPAMTKTMLICAISLYFCARIVFISKGFRIFYSNLPSCVYFILYLCAVEIVPIAIMIAGIISICNLLQ